MSDDQAERDTQPPAAISPAEYNPVPDVRLLPPVEPESLPPKAKENLLIRIDHVHERLDYQADRIDLVGTDVNKAVKGVEVLAQLVGELTLGLKASELTRQKTFNDFQTLLLSIEKNQHNLRMDVSGLRTTLATQIVELGNMKDAIAGLQRDDVDLRYQIDQERDAREQLSGRLDAMAQQLEAERHARNGNK